MNKYVAWWHTQLNRLTLQWRAKQSRGEDSEYLDTSESEIDAISEELYQKTLLEMDKVFKKWEGYRKQRTISDEEARQLLLAMLSVAIAKRNELTGMLEKSVSSGTLFERYYSKMQMINRLTNSAYTKMKIMQAAKERYEYQRVVYKKVTGKEYISSVQPNDGDKISDDVRDAWTEMEEAAGQMEVPNGHS